MEDESYQSPNGPSMCQHFSERPRERVSTLVHGYSCFNRDMSDTSKFVALPAKHYCVSEQTSQQERQKGPCPVTCSCICQIFIASGKTSEMDGDFCLAGRNCQLLSMVIWQVFHIVHTKLDQWLSFSAVTYRATIS